MPDETKDFLKAFLAINKQLALFTTALVPHQADADEIFQRTGLVLLERWSEFDASRSFLAWACGIARLQARRYLQEQGRQGQLLGDEASFLVERVVEQSARHLDERLDALRTCLKRLPADHRDLLTNCYTQGRKLQDVAVDLRMSPNALYLRLKRLREILHECVDGVLLKGLPT